MSENAKEQKKLSLKETASLSLAERHKILEPFIAATAKDFLNDPKLTEFSVLDGEEWETENDNIIYIEEPESTHSHEAFLNGYAPEDEGLYDN
ncbi:hypothetical protein [Nostoc sp.]|uniref:hypothetical protein n=1 Tax=Nostoc sp. TaxID=1180 RepID=UPI002FF91917